MVYISIDEAKSTHIENRNKKSKYTSAIITIMDKCGYHKGKHENESKEVISTFVISHDEKRKIDIQEMDLPRDRKCINK